MSKKPKKLTDITRAHKYALRIGYDYISRWPVASALNAYHAGLRAGRREGKKP